MSPTLARFRDLHNSGCFVIPNPWDAGSAKYLAHLGFQALATTSSGFAFAQGCQDLSSQVGVEAMLEYVHAMAAATPLPVNADFKDGFGKDLDDLHANVVSCVRTGVAGLSIEDTPGNGERFLYSREDAIRRVKEAREAIDSTGIPVLLTARCEAYLRGEPEALKTSLDRLAAFAEAGADCLFAPGVRKPEDISEIVRAVAPKPVNVLVSGSGTGLSVPILADLGVRRISVGSALARVAWGAFMRSARSITETGSFESFGDAASFEEFQSIFEA